MASKTTTDVDEIREWATPHGGKPAAVAGTGKKGHDLGMLRLMFPDSKFADDENLREVTWDQWAEAFEANGLALVYDPASRFNKLVSRPTSSAHTAHGHGQSSHAAHAKSR